MCVAYVATKTYQYNNKNKIVYLCNLYPTFQYIK